jgi:hypothetical protein
VNARRSRCVDDRRVGTLAGILADVAEHSVLVATHCRINYLSVDAEHARRACEACLLEAGEKRACQPSSALPVLEPVWFEEARRSAIRAP